MSWFIKVTICPSLLLTMSRRRRRRRRRIYSYSMILS